MRGLLQAGGRLITALRALSSVERRGGGAMQFLPDFRKGKDILNDCVFNKGVAFSPRERDRFGLRGLLPPAVKTLDDQIVRIYRGFLEAGQPTEKHSHVQPETAEEAQLNLRARRLNQYLYLTALQDRNETLFQAVVNKYIDEIAPVIYTPTVGEACRKAQILYRRPRGMYITAEDRGDIFGVIQNCSQPQVEIVVVTDGSRILGLGDLGVQGMPIPIGKLSLYAAAAGFHPSHTLPILLDVGTNRQSLLDDPQYLGLRQRRLEGQEYIELVDEFMQAISLKYPNAVIQFEDFRNPYAEMLLNRYRKKYRMFNDDIQGTGAVTLAGLLTALKKSGSSLTTSRIVCVGAGSAGLGVCNSLVYAMVRMGLTEEQARNSFWLLDEKGLLTRSRETLHFGQEALARSDAESLQMANADLKTVIEKIRPNILLGLSGAGGAFSAAALTEMGQHCEHPIIFAMSNPTANSECSAIQAYNATQGRAIFASGSPFPPCEVQTPAGLVKKHPSQSNNMFIFPGVGLGAFVSGARILTDQMFYNAALALTETVSQEQLDAGEVFPRLANIRDVSLKVAAAVAKTAQYESVATAHKADWLQAMHDHAWEPVYAPLSFPNRAA
eukprot:m.808601 g.808601  ORF g.808601 m.808601 type:complete len:611 (+) comp59313_c1_seq3:29-1861(+)